METVAMIPGNNQKDIRDIQLLKICDLYVIQSSV